MKKFSRALTAAGVGAALFLAGCSSGGSEGGDPTVNTGGAAAVIGSSKCAAVSGPFDSAQTAIAGGFSTLGAQMPQGGALAATLGNAVAHLLDSPDGFVAALQNLAATQDPQAFASELAGAGDGLACGLAFVDQGLADLTAQLAAQSANVPALPGLLNQVRDIELRMAQGLSGPGDITDLSSELAALRLPLQQLQSQLPANVNIPEIQLALGMITQATSGIAAIIDRVGHLDAAGAQGAITGMALGLAGLAHVYQGLGIPGGVVTPIYQLLLAGNTQVLIQLVPYLGPLLQAVTQVLQPNGTPISLFQQILAGGLSGNDLTGAAAGVLALLAGGGSVNGVPIPSLNYLLNLLIPGGVPH